MPLHQFTSGLQLGYGIQPVNPVPVDSYSGPYVGGSTTAAVSLANSTIPAALRFLSLEVRILAPDPDNAGQTLAYKYWYRGSTADSGLVEFSAGTNITDYVTSFNGLTGAVQGVSAAVAGTGIFVNAATGAVTITNTGVQSFNGNTGAIQGVSSWNGQTGAVSFVDYVSSFNGLTGAVNGVTVGGVNTFTQLNTFNSGITTAFIYASIGSTFAGTLRVVGGTTLAGRVDIGGVLDVVGGTTLESTLDVEGVARFASGITVSGAARFAAGITASSVDVTGVLKANGGLTASTLDVTEVSRFAGGATFSSSADFAGAARFAVGLTSSGDVVVGSAGTVFKSGGDATVGATLTVNGNFYVQGTVTTVNRTDLAIDDKIITLGRTLASDTLADGGGLVLKGSSDRTLTWNDTADAWTSNDNFNVGSAFGYKVNNTTVLASGMIHGLSASAGSISGGTWAANIIGLAYGGTNKNLVSVGASGGVVFKDGTGLSITAAGTNGQILQANASGAPTWVNLTTLTGLTADSVKITDRDTTAGTMYLTFTTDAGAAMSLFIDKSSGVTYDANTNTLSCTKLEATVDGGVF